MLWRLAVSCIEASSIKAVELDSTIGISVIRIIRKKIDRSR